ncbi:MAG: hypothetical protein ABSE87_13430 [Terracidiphilus sp.]|jgi:hypothetical protein
MLTHSALKSAGSALFSALLTLAALQHHSALAQTAPPQSDSQARPSSDSPAPGQQPSPATDSNRPTRGSGKGNTVSQREVPASQSSPGREGHPAETNPGRTPHSSENGAIIAGASVGAAVVIGELIAHHNKSPEKLLHDGPQVPDSFDMNGFVIKGLVHPNWPIVLDFMIDSPGAVLVDILAADKHHYQSTLLNTPNRRAYAIFRLPPNFGTKLQTAVYHVSAIPSRGATTPPRLRTYGLGAGDHAVGSVAIDQLTFQPATIHPQAREVANYSFHAHSAFDGVRAEFIFTTLYNGRLLVQKEDEKKLSPIPEGERARGTWEGKGKPGEHMLQVRAWRGLENGGDWVVAWSPDIVDVVK